MSCFWWDQAGGSAKSLGCKDDPCLSVNSTFPKVPTSAFLEARKSRKTRESRKNRKIESRCEAEGLPFCTCNLMGTTNCLCFVALIGFGTAVADAALASKEAPASKNGTAVKPATVEMTKGEDGPPEKVRKGVNLS